MYFWETKEEYYDRVFCYLIKGESVTYQEKDEICEKNAKEIKQGELAFIFVQEYNWICTFLFCMFKKQNNSSFIRCQNGL